MCLANRLEVDATLLRASVGIFGCYVGLRYRLEVNATLLVQATGCRFYLLDGG